MPDFEVALFGPGDVELARSNKSEGIAVADNTYPLTAFSLVEDGLYRVVIIKASSAESTRFRVKIREAEPIEAAESQDALQSLAGNLLNSLTEIASDLLPTVGLAEGNRAPDFSLQSLDDVQIRLAELRDQVLLLNFWGTWCGPCRREMPEFQKAYEDWQSRGFEIIAIAYNDTEQAMIKFRDEFGLSFPLALDDSGEINDLYGIQTRPSSYLLGKDGVILARHFGIMTESQLSELLVNAFAEE